MSAQKYIKRGFTLIELLITIAIIGILSAAVLVGINPAQKINAANDSKAKSDVAQVATAAQSYFTAKQTYPLTIATLTTSSELSVTPTVPTSAYTYTYAPSNASCTAANPCLTFSMSATLKAPATAGNGLWCYQSSKGTASERVSDCPQ